MPFFPCCRHTAVQGPLACLPRLPHLAWVATASGLGGRNLYGIVTCQSASSAPLFAQVAVFHECSTRTAAFLAASTTRVCTPTYSALGPPIQCAHAGSGLCTCPVHPSRVLARGLVLFVPCTGGDHDTLSPISILSRDEGSTNHWSQSPGACLHAHVSAVVGQERCCGFKPTLLVFDFLSPVCSARERPQLSSADEFRGQPTTHFAAQDLLCTMLPITWGSGVGAMVFDAPFFRVSAIA